MAAKQKDVEKIIATVPGFQTQWQGFLKEWEKETSPPWYLGMGELAHYLVENYAQRATAEFPELFASVEALLHNPDPELENLITVGLLEDIQKRCQSSGLWGCSISRMAGAEKPCRLGWNECINGTGTLRVKG